MNAIAAALPLMATRWKVALNNNVTDEKHKVQVIDGPPLVNLEDRGVTVGWAPDELSVTTEQEPGGLDSERVRFQVFCCLWVRIGEPDMKLARDEAFGMLDKIRDDLKADPRLDRNVLNARLRFIDLEQLQNKDGTWAFMVFTVTCQAFE